MTTRKVNALGRVMQETVTSDFFKCSRTGTFEKIICESLEVKDPATGSTTNIDLNSLPSGGSVTVDHANTVLVSDASKSVASSTISRQVLETALASYDPSQGNFQQQINAKDGKSSYPANRVNHIMVVGNDQHEAASDSITEPMLAPLTDIQTQTAGKSLEIIMDGTNKKIRASSVSTADVANVVNNFSNKQDSITFGTSTDKILVSDASNGIKESAIDASVIDVSTSLTSLLDQKQSDLGIGSLTSESVVTTNTSGGIQTSITKTDLEALPNRVGTLESHFSGSSLTADRVVFTDSNGKLDTYGDSGVKNFIEDLNVSSSPSSSEVLMFVTDKWTNSQLSKASIGLSTFGDVPGVAVSNEVAGHILSYDGTNWVNQAPAAGITVDSHLNGTTNPVTSQAIQNALDGKLDKTAVQNSIDGSTNPVQSAAIDNALRGKQSSIKAATLISKIVNPDNTQRSHSTVRSGDPSTAESMLDGTNYWTPATPWDNGGAEQSSVTIDCGDLMSVRGVVTQGGDPGQYVSRIRIKVSSDNVSFTDMGLFDANTDTSGSLVDDRAYVYIKPISARYVRVHPVEFTAWPSMRLAVLVEGSLGEISGVSLSSLAEGHVLCYNSSNNIWENKAPDTVITVDSHLNGTTNPVTSQAIQNALGGKQASLSTFGDVPGVAISNEVTGHILSYDGANWINQAPAAGITVDSHLNGTTNPVESQVIQSALLPLEPLANLEPPTRKTFSSTTVAFKHTPTPGNTGAVVDDYTISGNSINVTSFAYKRASYTPIDFSQSWTVMIQYKKISSNLGYIQQSYGSDGNNGLPIEDPNVPNYRVYDNTIVAAGNFTVAYHNGNDSNSLIDFFDGTVKYLSSAYQRIDDSQGTLVFEWYDNSGNKMVSFTHNTPVTRINSENFPITWHLQNNAEVTNMVIKQATSINPLSMTGWGVSLQDKLGTLNHIQISNPVSGQVLKYNGSFFVNSSTSGSIVSDIDGVAESSKLLALLAASADGRILTQYNTPYSLENKYFSTVASMNSSIDLQKGVAVNDTFPVSFSCNKAFTRAGLDIATENFIMALSFPEGLRTTSDNMEVSYRFSYTGASEDFGIKISGANNGGTNFAIHTVASNAVESDKNLLYTYGQTNNKLVFVELQKDGTDLKFGYLKVFGMLGNGETFGSQNMKDDRSYNSISQDFFKQWLASSSKTCTVESNGTLSDWGLYLGGMAIVRR